MQLQEVCELQEVFCLWWEVFRMFLTIFFVIQNTYANSNRDLVLGPSIFFQTKSISDCHTKLE